MKSIVHIITPIITEGIRSLDDVAPFLRDDLEVRHSLIDKGPASIECHADEVLSVPGILEQAVKAEADGATAVIIDCMGDPGVAAARELLTIPVLGPGESCMHVASMIGHSFAFVTVLERLHPLIDSMVARYGLRDNYAAFRAIDIPVLEIEQRLSEVSKQLAEQSLRAIRENRAGAIILGCTGFLGCAEAIEARLAQEGLSAPVLDPIPLTLHLADALNKVSLTHSGVTYPPPLRKPLRGFDLGDVYAAAE